MNPYFAMNPNDDEEEQQPNAFNVDDESDIYFRRQGLTHSVSYKAEAISPLMNVLQFRVSLTEEQLTEVHQ
ncbi:hypothetical protein Tco_0856315 [Tanacetum coccineum]|uniref:Uncharacterized protein n=1 Tax=Tanacetum coccineum TaxID=301880 RepID=A0ABQ5B6X6_9ASTR